MFFLFGWGRQTSKDYGATPSLTCPNCNNESYLLLLHLRLWFTLFLIPVLPYRSTHYLLCPICTRGFKLPDDRVEAARALNRATFAFLNKRMTKDEYQEIVKSTILFDEAIESMGADKLTPLALPESCTCRKCGTRLVLDDAERASGRFTCTACGAVYE